MAFNIILWFLISLSHTHADVAFLTNKKTALQFEYDFIKEHPATYYLVIDLSTQEAYLKADAHLLRTCKILDQFGISPTQTQQLSLQTHILPHTPEPKTISRNRPLPLNFSGRLVTGPKHRSLLYFMPSFMIQSNELPKPTHLSGICLSNQDIKAIASALKHQSSTILLPPNLQHNGKTK
jgi:hypothetical protein